MNNDNDNDNAKIDSVVVDLQLRVELDDEVKAMLERVGYEQSEDGVRKYLADKTRALVELGDLLPADVSTS